MIDQSKQLETILRETAHFSHAEQAARVLKVLGEPPRPTRYADAAVSTFIHVGVAIVLGVLLAVFTVVLVLP